MSNTTSKDSENENSNMYFQSSLIWIHLKYMIKHGNTHSNERLSSIFNHYFEISRGKIFKNHFSPSFICNLNLNIRINRTEDYMNIRNLYKNFKIMPRNSLVFHTSRLNLLWNKKTFFLRTIWTIPWLNR